MKIQQLIRESILQQIGLIEEDIKGKIRIVQKLPNITDDQKEQIIEILNDKPHLENPKGFDWTKAHKYTWDNFQVFFDESDPLKELKKLKHGKDYITVKGIEAPGLLGVYIPLNWEASKLIADEKLAGTRGKWCIAHSDKDSFWEAYTTGSNTSAGGPSVFMMFVFNDDKYCLQITPEVATTWDKHDTADQTNRSIPGVNVNEVLRNTKKLQTDVRADLLKDRLWKLVGATAGTKVEQNEDGSYDVYGDVKWTNRMSKLPVTYNKVTGDFIVDNCGLTTLLGSPKEVGGGFDCSRNRGLQSFNYSPIKVDGDFDCSDCDLDSLEGVPKKIGGGFDCSYNKLGSNGLHDGPEEVGGDYICNYTGIKNYDGCPKKVGGNFDGRYNIVKSINIDCKVGGDTLTVDMNADGSINVNEDFVCEYDDYDVNLSVVNGDFELTSCAITNSDYLPIRANNVVIVNCDVPGVKSFDYTFDVITSLTLEDVDEVNLKFKEVKDDVEIETNTMSIANVQLEGKIGGDLTVTYTGDLSYDHSFDSYAWDSQRTDAEFAWDDFKRDETLEEYLDEDEDNTEEDWDEEAAKESYIDSYGEYMDMIEWDDLRTSYFRDQNKKCIVEGEIIIKRG